MSMKSCEVSDVKNKFTDIFTSDRYRKIVIYLGIGGILLIFMSNFFKKDDSKSINMKVDEKISAERYINNLQQNLESIVSSIKGAGKCKVLVTLENGSETIYATEEKKNKEASEDKSGGETTRKKESDDCEKKYITIKDSEGAERALAVTEIQPKIKGVIIVCPGGDDPQVQQRVVNAVTTALDITSKRVCVTKSV